MIMTLELTLSGEKLLPLRILIETVAVFSDGAETFIFTTEGINFQTMDSSGAAFFTFQIPKEYFDTYAVNESRLIALNLEDFRKVITRPISNDEKITLKMDDDKNRFFVILKKPSRSQRTYSLTLHTPGEIEQQTFDRAQAMQLRCQIFLAPARTFKEILADLGVVADKSVKHMTIDVKSHTEAFFSMNRGSEGASAELVLNTPDPEKEQQVAPIKSIEYIGNNGPFSAVYDMDYLEKLTKLEGQSQGTLLEMGNGQPLRIKIQLDGDIQAMFLMAPRDDGEEEEEPEPEEDESESENTPATYSAKQVETQGMKKE